MLDIEEGTHDRIKTADHINVDIDFEFDEEVDFSHLQIFREVWILAVEFDADVVNILIMLVSGEVSFGTRCDNHCISDTSVLHTE